MTTQHRHTQQPMKRRAANIKFLQKIIRFTKQVNHIDLQKNSEKKLRKISTCKKRFFVVLFSIVWEYRQHVTTDMQKCTTAHWNAFYRRKTRKWVKPNQDVNKKVACIFKYMCKCECVSKTPQKSTNKDLLQRFTTSPVDSSLNYARPNRISVWITVKAQAATAQKKTSEANNKNCEKINFSTTTANIQPKNL